MSKFAVLSVIFLSVTLVGSVQEKQPPPNEPPNLWRASASQEDGKVVIQIARPEYVAPRRPVPDEAMKWQSLRSVTLGKTVRAFGVNGKSVEPKAVLKALAEPKGVVVFVRFHEPLSDPDPFYLGMLREGTIILVVNGGDIYDLRP